MTLNKILRWISTGAVFAVPFIPLFVPSSLFFPFITGKNFLFRILVEIGLGAFIMLALRDRSYRPRRSWVGLAVGIFTIVTGVADALGLNPYKSFWSNYERMEGFVTILHLAGYFVLAGTVLGARQLWEKFFQVSIGVSGVIGIYGLMQLAGKIVINQGGVRLDATFGNATYLAAYMFFHIFLTLLFLFRSESRGAKYRYGILIALQAFILYHTATRGTILGLLAGVFLTGLLVTIFEREHPRLRKAAGAGVAAVLILVGAFFALRNTSVVQNSTVLKRFADISLEETTTKSRFLVWGIAWEGVKERPILGYGQDNFNYVFNEHYHPQMYAQEPWFDRAHNIVMDWLISGGFIGLAAYLSLFVAALWSIWRKGSSLSVLEKSILTGLLGGYFFQNLFVFDNITSYILFFSILGWLHGQALREALVSEKRFVDQAVLNAVGLPIAAVLTIVALYFFNGPSIMANQSMLQALVGGNNPEAALGKFKKALAYESHGTPEIREQLLHAASQVNSSSAPAELKQSFYDTAREEMTKQTSGVGDARYELFFGNFFKNFGKTDEALAHLERARELSPNKQAVYFELGAVYLEQGKYKEALEYFKTAYELAPQYDEARKLYAMAATYAGNKTLAEALLTERFGSSIVLDDRLVQAYIATKQFDKVVKIWEARVAEEPANPQFRFSLAAAYLETGARQKALDELAKAAEADPSIKEQADFYIKEIKAGRNP
jgi:O-antigen ligase/tetratricopeptide (TPR) repeat protein